MAANDVAEATTKLRAHVRATYYLIDVPENSASAPKR
jgi:hypothetical protein